MNPAPRATKYRSTCSSHTPRTATVTPPRRFAAAARATQRKLRPTLGMGTEARPDTSPARALSTSVAARERRGGVEEHEPRARLRAQPGDGRPRVEREQHPVPDRRPAAGRGPPGRGRRRQGARVTERAEMRAEVDVERRLLEVQDRRTPAIEHPERPRPLRVRDEAGGRAEVPRAAEEDAIRQVVRLEVPDAEVVRAVVIAVGVLGDEEDAFVGRRFETAREPLPVVDRLRPEEVAKG